MNQEQSLAVAMQLIMYGGEAKSCAMEAIKAAKAGDGELANKKLGQADEALLEAHHAQTDLLTREAQGQETPLHLFLIHGQDHLMTSIAFVDLAREIVDLHQKLLSNQH